jgi:DNA-binding transcriptional MerR regulator
MYTIGKLASLAGVRTDSVRFYERQGLIEAARKTDCGYRLYGDDALRRIEFIKHAQRCGFSLAEIRELIVVRNGDVPGEEICSFADSKRKEIAETMRALQEMSRFLSSVADYGRKTRAFSAEAAGAHSGYMPQRFIG